MVVSDFKQNTSIKVVNTIKTHKPAHKLHLCVSRNQRKKLKSWREGSCMVPEQNEDHTHSQRATYVFHNKVLLLKLCPTLQPPFPTRKPSPFYSGLRHLSHRLTSNLFLFFSFSFFSFFFAGGQSWKADNGEQLQTPRGAHRDRLGANLPPSFSLWGKNWYGLAFSVWKREVNLTKATSLTLPL